MDDFGPYAGSLCNGQMRFMRSTAIFLRFCLPFAVREENCFTSRYTTSFPIKRRIFLSSIPQREPWKSMLSSMLQDSMLSVKQTKGRYLRRVYQRNSFPIPWMLTNAFRYSSPRNAQPFWRDFSRYRKQEGRSAFL